MKKQTLLYSILSALFVVLISLGAYMKVNIPGSPIPVVLQNMFIMLTALVVGRKWGVITVTTYLLIGLIGLPVFAGGTSGPAVFFGPTGGYLISYLPAVFFTGLISDKNIFKKSIISDAAALIVAIIIIYFFGLQWLHFKLKVNDISWQKVLSLGFYPFIILDLIKAAAAVATAQFVKPLIKNIFHD